MKDETYYLFVFLPVMMWGQSDFDKAEKLYKANKMDQVELVFESVLKSSPSDLKTIEYLGDIAGHYKAWDKTIVYYKKLKQLRPSEANDGYLSRRHIEEYFKRYTSAEQQYRKAIAAGSTKVGGEMLANLYKNKMNQPGKAAKIKI